MKFFNKFEKGVNSKGTAKETNKVNIIHVDKLPENAPIRKLFKNR